MTCKLAIVIPYYKHAFFEATLQSLADQTDQRFRVYIGDDASLENCTVLLEKFSGKFDFEYLRFEQNLGGQSLVEQWNRCMGMVKSEEWVMILGDDDRLDNNVVASWYKHFDFFSSKSEVTRFASVTIDENGTRTSTLFTHPEWETAAHSYFKKFKGLSRSSLSEYIFSKSAYHSKGFRNYPLAWHSDDMAWMDFSGSLPIYSINESAVEVRMSALNISGNHGNNEMKTEATAAFLKDVVTEKLDLFSKNDKREILASFEQSLKMKRRLSIGDWFSLLVLYAKNGAFLLFFVRRILLNTQKKYRSVN